MSDAVTTEDLTALETAIMKGVRTVKYTDKEITYRSLDEMFRIRDWMRRCLGIITTRGERRVAQHEKALC